MSVEVVNERLATACQKCGSACCKKGQIFLPRKEHERIRQHVVALGMSEAAEFDGRTTDHGLFFLYDQRNGCQFLDDQNLCRLHRLGIKPSECFWWPYHVYASEAGELEVRLFTTCCDAHKMHDRNSLYLGWIKEESNRIGVDVIRAFRQAYGGSADTKLVGRIDPIPEVAEGS
jgi:hypothetical protein